MRIALITDLNYTGGIRTYFEMLVGVLLAEGADIRALVSVNSDDDAFFNFATKHGFDYEVLPVQGGLFQKPLFAQLWELSQLIPFILRHKPNLIFISTGTPGQWFTPLLLPVPSLQVLHTSPVAFSRKSQYILKPLLACLSATKQIITVSEYASKCAKKYWNKNISFIHNATPFPEAVSTPKKTFFRKHVLTAGHVIGYKNPQLWVNVAQRVIVKHPDALFTWYGEGPLLDTMRQQTKGIEQVEFCGKGSQMDDLYASASLYFHPSLLENHSMAILEAMSFGLPCVTSNRGGLPEAVAHEITGYVEDANDAEAFAQRICSLFDNPDLAQQMSLAAQQQVKCHFMPAQWAQHLLAKVRTQNYTQDDYA